MFTKIATLIEEHSDTGVDDFIDGEIEPLIASFIEEYYCDLERGRITNYLWAWFTQWRASRGLWAHSLSSFIG